MPTAEESERVSNAIRQAQAGDAEAFEAVILTYQRPLRSWISQWCAGGLDPDEIAHRTFIAAFKSIGRFTPGTNCFAWLCAIGRNILHEELRILKRHAARTLTIDADIDMAVRDIDGDESFEVIKTLRECMSGLPADAADLAAAYYSAEKSIAECSAEFKKSESAIKSQLHWLRTKLRNCMVFKLGRAWL